MGRRALAVLLAAGTVAGWVTGPQTPCFAAEKVTPPSLSPPDTWLPRSTATLRVLDKVDGTVTTLSLHTGESATYRTLSIAVLGCYVRPPDLPQDAAAHLKVTDSTEGAPGFDGWVLRNEPGANLLEHPVYDIQLTGCS
jgi:hypothetical protein